MGNAATTFLRKAANYVGNSVGGSAVSTLITGAGPTELLFAITAGALVAEGTLELLDRDRRIDRIEVWLEQLVRQQGGLIRAIESIANEGARHPLVDVTRARSMLAIMKASDDPDPTSHARVVCDVESALCGLSPGESAALYELCDRLDSISRDTSAARAAAERTDERTEGMRVDLEEIRTSIRDLVDDKTNISHENDNATLRTRALRETIQKFDFEAAASLAKESAGWYAGQASVISPLQSLELLDALIEEGIIRIDHHGDLARRELTDALRTWMRAGHAQLGQVDLAAQLKLSSMYARAEGVLSTPTNGLRLLEGRSDPWAIRRRLVLLSDAGRTADAADQVRGLMPDEVWVDRAVVVFVEVSEFGAVHELLDWAREHLTPERRRRLVLQFANAVLDSAAKYWNPPAPPDLPGGMLEQLHKALELLRADAVQAAASVGPISSFELVILQIALGLASWTDDHRLTTEIAARLQYKRPLPPPLINLALCGRVEAGQDWPVRIRQEHPDTFETILWAIAIEGRALKRYKTAIDSAERLMPRAESTEDRERLFELVSELAQFVPTHDAHRVDGIRKALLDPSNQTFKTWEAVRLIRAGDLAAAETLLDGFGDEHDTPWLQAHGCLLIAQGKEEEGLRQLAKAAMRMDTPDILSSVARQALQSQYFAIAEPLLRRGVQLRPNDVRSVGGLAMLCQRLDKHAEATEHWRELMRLDPGEPAHAINAGASCVLQGRIDEALDLLQPVCDGPEPPCIALVRLAELLVDRGRASDALVRLERHKPRLWDDPQFLGAYWQTAFAAEQEDAGHDALLRLRDLQQEGVVPKGAIVEMSVEQVLKIAGDHNEAMRKRAEMLLVGRAPWLFVDSAEGSPAIQGWAQRTFRRRWIPESPHIVASASLYATNGWSLAQDPETGKPSMEPIRCSEPGRPVVVDLSALITLHELKLLPQVAEYFKQLVVPSTYLYRMYVDHSRLRLHQPSRAGVASDLQHALVAGQLRAIDDDQTSRPRLDEHYPERRVPQDVYHLVDLIDALEHAKAITDAQRDRARRVSHRPRTVGESHRALRLGDEILLSLSTLSTLRYCGILDIVLDSFGCVISRDDAALLQAELVTFRQQDKLRGSHEELWTFLRTDRRILHSQRPPDSKPEEPSSDVSLDALQLADERGLPLLVDDRFPQNILLCRRGRSEAAFSCAQLLQRMWESGSLTLEAYATALGTLFEWRYRFLVPPMEALLYWARSSRSGLPGPSLVALADYAHAGLRDPGLFSGVEQTNPPTTLAIQYQRAWESLAGTFVAAVWSDPDWKEQEAEQLSAWAIRRLLPSPPQGMPPHFRLAVEAGYAIFLIRLVSGLCRCRDNARARNAMDCVAELLGIGKDELERQALELLHGT